MRSGARCAGAKPDHQENSSDLIKLKVYLLHTTTLFNLASQPPFCCLCGISWIPHVVSMEKMEDTSLLPSPILISIRSKMAFQFIELKDRETLVETLLERLKQVHANHPVHYDTSTNDKDMGWTHITCFVLDKQVQ
ncbi:TBC1 domain family member 8-like [Sciurus carolinensis]|uniref:TBC1 domain family member 8-like n=1 Tax=Sciurus carolinensis TaxID=30640 RepID=UPI001FB399CF|nr:TBC1 domain family member 8-like [Sciurus carolinensis]